jgi:hypothetical protein
MKNYVYILLMSLSLLAAPGVYAQNVNVLFYYNGPATANTAAAPSPNVPVFATYCNGTCGPTTTFPLYDPILNIPIGTAYVWGNNYQFAGTSECFTEFIQYKLPGGSIYTLGNPAGTCGAFIDQSLVQPSFVHNPGSALIAGGGSGNIVAGTGIYRGLKGTYVDRVFVEFFNGSISYYDALYFTLTIKL